MINSSLTISQLSVLQTLLTTFCTYQPLVTGGNRGIGLALSEAVAEAGASVAIIYNSQLESSRALSQTIPALKDRDHDWLTCLRWVFFFFAFRSDTHLPQIGAKDADDRAKEIAKKYNVKVKAYQCDVGQQDKVKAVFKTINSEMGPVTGRKSYITFHLFLPDLSFSLSSFSFISSCVIIGFSRRQCWCLSREGCIEIHKRRL